jgi:transposase
MAHIPGYDRSQMLLLPETVDDYVGPDNPVRFIEAFVDGLDLEAAGFARVEPKATGRPGYAPADLLKLYIYGYLNRIRSSRRLEAEAGRNLEVIWLLRHLQPDFKTIADFRRDNRNAFRQVFRAFVLLCRELDLFGRELIAVDGTRIKAVNNKDRNFTRASLTRFIAQADARLADYLGRLDQSDAEEGRVGGTRTANLAEKIAALCERRERHTALLAELERTGEDQISLTDPDSRAMAAHTRVAVGYNVQVAVDAKHKLIVEQQVTNPRRIRLARCCASALSPVASSPPYPPSPWTNPWRGKTPRAAANTGSRHKAGSRRATEPTGSRTAQRSRAAMR